jgi:hypothetical protein
MKYLNVIFATFIVAKAQYAAPLLGDVALTSVEGVEDDGDFGRQYLPVGTHIFGPFEAGFSSRQDFVLAKLGCATGKGYLTGGIDTWTAEQVVAKDCGVQLPRWEGNNYISLLGTCGGHTGDYHFHEHLTCLYEQKGTHSTRVGDSMDGKGIYGKWENFEKQEKPLLDACGGHWGPTPDGDGESYHYHVQGQAPFTIGCYGPNPDNSLVTVEQCRSLYSGCGDGDNMQLDTPLGLVEYDPWCPCYDADGSNVGNKPLVVFSNPEKAKGPGGESVLQKPSTSGGNQGGKSFDDRNKFSKFKKFKKFSGKFMGKFGNRNQFGVARFDGASLGGKFATVFASKFPVTQESFEYFQIKSKKHSNYCLDASAKKISLKICENKKSQRFLFEDGILKFGYDCIGPSLVLGPCTTSSVTAAVQSGRAHTLITVTKCLQSTNAKKLKVKQCKGKSKKQTFEITQL